MSDILSIRLLGTLDLRFGSTPLPSLGSARGAALLACLVLDRDTPRLREHLAFRLWPDSAEPQARTNLRHLLHDLRRSLPNADAFLDVRARTIQWRPDAPCWLDIAELEHAAAAAGLTIGSARQLSSTEEISLLQRAVALYRGDLLETCYDEWITPYRDRFRHWFLAALDRLAAMLAERGDYGDAIGFVERMLRHEPLREDAYRTLMRLHDARGDRARAVEAYRACAATLERELGVEPSAATRQAYEALLRDDADARSASGGRRPRGATSNPPLVGRADEWARLTTTWRTAERGQPCLVLVSGEPGVGKTRLVDELRSWCGRRGAVTAEARSYAAEGGLAYAPLVTWLRSPGVHRHVSGLDARTQSELRRVLPDLPSRTRRLPAAVPLSEDEHRRRLFDAAAAALLSLGTPTLLVADDAQWCDQETLRFIHYLLRTASNAPLLVVATARADELERNRPLLELLAGLRALDRLTELELGRLTRDATTALAASLTSGSVDHDSADALFRETDGNPLFIVETVRAGWQSAAGPPGTIAPRIQAVIASRLEALSKPARDLAGLAATLGRDFTIDVLAHAADMASDIVARHLDELWRARIVHGDDAGSYDFSHDKIREVAYLALSPPRRVQHHLRAATALKRARVHDVDAVSAQIAAHYDRAGVSEEAIRWYEAAAEAAQQLYASRDALRLLERALALLAGLPAAPERDARELAILTAMLTPVASVDGFASARLATVHRQIGSLTSTLGVDLPPQVLRSLAVSSLSRDDFESARRYGEQLGVRARTDADEALLVESEYVSGIAAFWSGELRAARHHFEAAVAGHRPDRRRAHLLRFWLDPQIVCLSRLGNTLWLLGDPVAAGRARDEALALGEAVGHEHSHRTALVFAAVLALDMGDIARLRRHVAELERVRSDHDAAPTRVATASLGAYLRVLDGDPRAGIAAIRETIDALRDGGHAPGMRAVVVRLLMAACDAASDPRGRLEAAELALAMGGAARLWEAEAHRARAESLAALGAADEEVVASLERAVAVARRQGAEPLERRAADLLRRYTAAAPAVS